MATKFITPSWRMPRNSNQSKASNYSINFDGSGHLNLNDLASSLQSLSVGSISMWWKPVDATPSSGNALFTVASTTVTNDYFAMYNLSDGKFYAQLKDNNLNNWILQTDAAAFSDDTWAHVVITQNGTEPELYVNGSKPAQTFTTSTNKTKWWDDITVEQVNIGTLVWSGGTSGTSTGAIGPVSVFDYALTGSAVTALYNSGIPANPLAVTTPPVAYYDLGQGSAYASGSAGIVEPNLAAATGSTVFNFSQNKIIRTSNDIFDDIVTDSNKIGICTISYWFKNDNAGAQQDYMSLNDDNVSPSNFRIDTSNRILYMSKTNYMRYPAPSDTGGWNHHCWVFNSNTSYSSGTSGQTNYYDDDLKFYLNGVEQQVNYNFSAAPNNTAWNGFNIAESAQASGASLNFEMSNLQLFNTNLSSANASTLYNNGTPLQSYTDVPQSGSLKAWYKLDLDNSIYNSDDTNWNVQNNFQLPIYNDSLKFFGSYVGGSPSISYPQLRTTTTSVSPGTNGITYSAFVRIPLPVQGNETTLFYANLGSIKISNKVQFKTEVGSKYKNFNKDFEDGAWHHVLVYVPTPSGTGNLSDVKCYVDGEEITSTSIIGGSTYSTAITNIYGIYVGNLPPKHWEISNWAYWLGDKTSDLATIYNGGTPGDISSLNPDVWYKLDSDNVSLTGSNGLDYGSAVDSSGNGNNGRIGGEDASAGGPVPIIVNNYPIIASNAVSSGMDSTNLVPSNLIKSIPYSGYSMYFDGAVDTVDVPDSSTLKPSTITISIWFKGGAQSSNYTYLIGKYYTGSGPAYGFYTGASLDKLAFLIRKGDDTGWAETTLADSGVVMDNNWHNAVGIFDGTNVKLYIDGVLKSTVSAGASGITYGSGDLTIGAFLNTGTLDFNGYLSNAAIWDKAITEDEILRVYNGGSPGNLSSLNPTSWWSLGVDSYFNGTNWICPDIGANTNNGTSDGLGADGLVGDGPNSLANGTSTNLDLSSDLVGNAPGSTGNSLSVNMNFTARTGSTP